MPGGAGTRNLTVAGGGSHIYPLKGGRNRTELAQMYVDIAINCGLSASILLLGFHLLVFALVDDLRNLMGKNLASFCTALLLEYTSTLISGQLKGTACYVNEIAAYYFIMASAFWMLTMSFDVRQTVHSSTNEMALSGSNNTGKQGKKFVFYSLWSWLMPALLTALVFFILPKLISDFDLDYQDFNREKCSFLETDMMYIFVTSVFGIILAVNTYFFISSVIRIYTTQSAVRRTTNNMKFKNYFQLYSRLAIIMGVTWTAEFIIYYYEFDILCLTFKIINTFEGLFIVLAFTCRKEVLLNVKSLHIAKSLRDTTFHRYMSVRKF
ncbi:G-protein coupled receptor Mth-like [Planococcus citri]|uniref:G-protein coupled receptor Mth-like n=1 Tax=Planococcus citri TaxID=170843 RepID=UPI0031FA196A